MRLFLHRLFNLHAVAYYTVHARYTRGVCSCGWEGDVTPAGKFY